MRDGRRMRFMKGNMEENMQRSLKGKDLLALRALRQALHAHPGLSGEEGAAREILTQFLRKNTSLEVIALAGSLVAIHREPEEGALAFRGDMDAIPGPQGPFHGCGHDGHSALLAGLALLLEGKKLGKTILLLFQGGEETGQGALPLRDALLERERVDAFLGFHNLPGYPAGKVLLRPGAFACASQGLILTLEGKQAHAAYPEQGRNPLPVLGALAAALPGLAADIKPRGLLLATPVGLQAGGENFGVAPGLGTLYLTLRAQAQGELEALEKASAAFLAKEGGPDMALTMRKRDVFPDTVNDPALYARCAALLGAAGIPWEELGAPMRWSEDFGWFGKARPSLYLGFGAGEDWPGLHTPGYCFNDALLETGPAALFCLAKGL